MKLAVRHVSIPMRYRFGHARAARSLADNVLVEITLDDGTRGWGEAVPRSYVTGESISTVFAALTASRRDLVPVSDSATFGDVSRALAELDLTGTLTRDGSPRALAAAAALELAVLDAYARREERPLLDAVSLVPSFSALAVAAPPRTVRQTLTIGDELEAAIERAGTLSSVPDVKVKLGFGFELDVERVLVLRARFGAGVDLRADANAAWDLDAARAMKSALPDGALSSVEEPLADRDLAGCAQLRGEGWRVMLDESLCDLDDAERAIAAGAADLFNLRLSKCGGLFGTLRLVARAEAAGVAWQLGCMVGESGILSSVGRQLVSRVRGARYFESTIPTKSLEADLTDATLDHLAGTRETPVPTGPGFGALVRQEVVDRYTLSRLDVWG